ncbi:MAG: hypothetical protein F6K50_15425 [Moorea sp. SIO3I7]|uniref:hypothetical protein n=1 Tax=Moorena sp. SIO3I8 TaxID=2607833 RepID=UPI0013BFE0A4|nr:hypothetical protein [Moorena sp. SIO3I8]NEN96870.1 hypothetical protein [Moorena sp. SIO3I7]NEO10307.1 hypothetical protein [Moorena sp. SIO3I8]
MRYAQPKAIGHRPRYTNAPVPRTNIPIQARTHQYQKPTSQSKRDRTSTKNQHPNSNAIGLRPRYAITPMHL